MSSGDSLADPGAQETDAMNAIGRLSRAALCRGVILGVVRFGGVGLLLVATDAAKESWHKESCCRAALSVTGLEPT